MPAINIFTDIIYFNMHNTANVDGKYQYTQFREPK